MNSEEFVEFAMASECADLGISIDEGVRLREFITRALEKAGANVIDSGFGFGQVDAGFELNGQVYSFSIMPRGTKQ